MKKPEMMTVQEIYKEKALNGYTVCFAEQCPLKGHCLHYLVGQQLPDTRSSYLLPLHPRNKSGLNVKEA